MKCKKKKEVDLEKRSYAPERWEDVTRNDLREEAR